VRTFFRQRGRGGSSDADVRTFSRKNTPDFFKFMMCPHEQRGGLSQCGHFADKGVNFSRFCADVFYVGLPYVLFLEDLSSFLMKNNLSSEDVKKCPNVLLFSILNS